MTKGTIVTWLKKEGDNLKKGEPIVEVESTKAVFDVEAPASGILRKILAPEGKEVIVGESIGIIMVPNEQISDAEIAAVTVTKEAEATPVPEEGLIEKTKERVVASPAAKRLARERGVDLTRLKGSGPGERIVEEDVRLFIEGTKMHPRVREIIPLSGIRKTAAERVSWSARTAPHAAVTIEVDMTNVAKLHEETRASYTEILVKAVAKALKEQPIMNATLEGEQIKIFEDVNVGIAVDTDKGLIVPVIREADKKSLSEVVSDLKELVGRARQGKLAKEDLTGGTFTITNLGMYGIDVFMPIINPPEAAILGVGRISEKPVVVNGRIVIKPVLQLSLSFDHRVIDGATAAMFLQELRQILANPYACKIACAYSKKEK